MDIYEHLPVLLAFENENDEIRLRLDKNGLGNFNLTEKSAQEIILSGCRITQEMSGHLQESITEVFEYEFLEQDNKKLFQFWGDYGRVTDEVEYETFTENFFEYTKEDLVLKGTALCYLYVDLHKRFFHNAALNTQLRDKLSFELTNEIERSQRKVVFFEDREKAKSETFQSEIKFLKKLQRILK